MPKCHHGRRKRDCGNCGGSSVYKTHTKNAAKRGIPNEIDEDRYRWLISQNCLYCGNPAGGVDRVKNEWGYTMLNSIPCCMTCNYFKRMLPAPTFLAHAAKIVAHNATYEEFKTRWITTRTGGPTCLSSNTNVRSASESPSTASCTRRSSGRTSTESTATTATMAMFASSNSSPGQRRFPSVSTAKLEDSSEHPADATEVCAED